MLDLPAQEHGFLIGKLAEEEIHIRDHAQKAAVIEEIPNLTRLEVKLDGKAYRGCFALR
ncbi:hypothetical protein BGE01nite_48730 [Brevifollis gellanilyticus]|uniref:Uncharacterized protein n=1 Tax=Brevifollis gellanilyticus TaxID=748831 RepID=A0A512MFS0_9BACT|nr:hypothetical protein BGE01nite_48730 [Brevifollis gellanilyticus]